MITTKLEDMLMYARKRMLQRKNKPLAKHANETLIKPETKKAPVKGL